MRVILLSELAVRKLSSLGRGMYSGRSDGARSLGLSRKAFGEPSLPLDKVPTA